MRDLTGVSREKEDGQYTSDANANNNRAVVLKNDWYFSENKLICILQNKSVLNRFTE
jgi:hypothetical protein